MKRRDLTLEIVYGVSCRSLDVADFRTHFETEFGKTVMKLSVLH